jgi:hypothetical protein
MTESTIQQQIRLSMSASGSKMFRNNQGSFRDANGRWIKFGIANPGGSDLIGWTPIEITPDMVGRTIAIFTAVEVKGPKTRTTPDQVNFIERIRADGGIAGVARSPADATAITQNFPN